MYTSIDLSIIHNPYFTILKLTADHCEIRSNNTGHTWLISVRGEKKYFTLHHKHHPQDPYHPQSAFLTMEECLLDIVNHDEFQLRDRKPAKYKPKDTFFDYIVKAYQGI